jgi:hypothetical protein
MIIHSRITSKVFPACVSEPKMMMNILFLSFTSVKVKKKAASCDTAFFQVINSRPYSGLIASTGQTSAHAPQSVHSSGSMV